MPDQAISEILQMSEVDLAGYCRGEALASIVDRQFVGPIEDQCSLVVAQEILKRIQNGGVIREGFAA